MPDLAVAGLDTPAQRVRHGARMAVVPERIPAAGRGLRRSWRCALLGEHWRPSYLAERDLWLCVPASRRVCHFQSLCVVPFGQYAHELLPFEGNWTLVRRVAVWPVNRSRAVSSAVGRLGCHGPLGACFAIQASISQRTDRVPGLDDVRARRLRVGIRPLALCEAEARKPRPICRMSGLSAALQSAGDAGI